MSGRIARVEHETYIQWCNYVSVGKSMHRSLPLSGAWFPSVTGETMGLTQCAKAVPQVRYTRRSTVENRLRSGRIGHDTQASETGKKKFFAPGSWVVFTGHRTPNSTVALSLPRQQLDLVVVSSLFLNPDSNLWEPGRAYWMRRLFGSDEGVRPSCRLQQGFSAEARKGREVCRAD